MSSSPTTPDPELPSDTNTSAEPSNVESPHPSFRDENSDIILRSSDNVDFHFYRAILSLLSPVFSSMLSLPNPTVPTESEQEPITVSEDSKTLALFLSWCHPRLSGLCQISEKLEEITTVLLCAEKYAIDSIGDRIRYMLLHTQKTMDLDPVRVYYISCRFRFEACAREAAQRAQKVPTASLYKECPELELVSAKSLAHLLQYHAACCAAARSVLQAQNGNRIAIVAGSHIPHCETCPDASPTVRYSTVTSSPSLPAWVVKYLNKCKGSFEQKVDLDSLQTAQTQFAQTFVGRAKACSECRDKIAGLKLFQLQESMKKLVTEAVSEVTLILPWEPARTTGVSAP